MTVIAAIFAYLFSMGSSNLLESVMYLIPATFIAVGLGFVLHELVKAAGIASCLVRDAGHTEVPESTITCLGIGPDEDEKIDKITQELKLLK